MYDFATVLNELRQWRAGTGAAPTYADALRLRREIVSENSKTLAAAASASSKVQAAQIQLGLIEDGPGLWDLVRLRHPYLICTDDRDGKQEWVEYAEGSWSVIANVPNLIRRIMDDMGIDPEQRGVEGKVRAVFGRLGAKRRVLGLALGEGSRIDYTTMRAVPLRGSAEHRVIGCASKLLLVDEDGHWREEPYSEELYVPIRLPVDPTAAHTPTPFIDRFLRTLLKDDAHIGAWNDWCSYCLSPGNWHKRILLIVSPKDSGKTTLLLLLRTLLGEANCQSVSARDMTNGFFHARMRTCLANISEEDTGYGKDFEALVKAVSGGSPIGFNIKYGAVGSYVPAWKPILAGNDAPTLIDDSGAYADRLLTLRTQPIPAAQQIKKPESWWIARFSDELPAYLRRLLDLMPRIEADGLRSPGQSANDVYRLRLESSPILQWLTDETSFEGGARHTKDEVYANYKRWAAANGCKVLAKSVFFRKLRALPEVRELLDQGRLDFDARPAGGGRKRCVRGLALDEQPVTTIRIG